MDETYSRSTAWEIRCCMDLIDNLEELVELYETAPDSWHGHATGGAPCPICFALSYLGPMLEQMRGVLAELQGEALKQLGSPRGSLLTEPPTIH